MTIRADIATRGHQEMGGQGFIWKTTRGKLLAVIYGTPKTVRPNSLRGAGSLFTGGEAVVSPPPPPKILPVPRAGWIPARAIDNRLQRLTDPLNHTDVCGLFWCGFFLLIPLRPAAAPLLRDLWQQSDGAVPQTAFYGFRLCSNSLRHHKTSMMITENSVYHGGFMKSISCRYFAITIFLQKSWGSMDQCLSTYCITHN